MSARVPRVAAEDPIGALQSTPNRAVFLNGFDKILATTRCESTIGPQKGTDEFLVNANTQDHCVSRKPKQEANHSAISVILLG